MKNSIIALVDCNSFYCSCERLFRPDLLKVPVGVLSNNDGCFVSRTNELKALGVKMGEPYFKVKDLCDKNKVAVFSANFSLYTNMSDRVMNTLSQFTPTLEVYSVDEAFLDLSGFNNFNIIEYAKTIKHTVELRTGIPVSIGIGSNKTLAKVANHIAKKQLIHNGVYSVLSNKDRENALKATLVNNIWGIGRKKSIALNSMNIKTALDLRNFKNDQLIQKMFTKVTRMTVDELRGIKSFELELTTPKKKEIISSRTFGSSVYDLQVLRESVASYASLACEKLRKQNSVCSIVEVWIRTNPFKNIPQYYAVDSFIFQTHTSDTRKVIKATWDILDKIFRFGFEYKKALVKLSGIRDKNGTQISFFDPIDTDDSDSLMYLMDIINDRDGPHTLKSAACGVDGHSWKMKQTLKSPRYVTGWNDLPNVN